MQMSTVVGFRNVNKLQYEELLMTTGLRSMRNVQGRSNLQKDLVKS